MKSFRLNSISQIRCVVQDVNSMVITILAAIHPNHRFVLSVENQDTVRQQKRPAQRPQCVHCKGSHTTYSKECPTWNQEKQIITLKTTLNIPFPEARKRVTSPPQSLASTANSGLLQPKTQPPIVPKPVTRNQGTQCQLFHAPALVKWSSKLFLSKNQSPPVGRATHKRC